MAWVVAMVVTTSSISAMCVTPERPSHLLTVNALRKFAFLAAAEVIEVWGSVFRIFLSALWAVGTPQYSVRTLHISLAWLNPRESSRLLYRGTGSSSSGLAIPV
ncbi:MAG: hypothetical protein JKY86_09450 [Gammaproteobacteria bacterium]|nr:hypothetical protein [Gammaproteobacteria bacterium]